MAGKGPAQLAVYLTGSRVRKRGRYRLGPGAKEGLGLGFVFICLCGTAGPGGSDRQDAAGCRQDAAGGHVVIHGRQAGCRCIRGRQAGFRCIRRRQAAGCGFLRGPGRRRQAGCGFHSTLASGCKRKYRLKKSELRTIFALRPEPFPPADDYLDLAPFFPPGWLEQKKREEEEDAAHFARMDAEFEAFRQQVIEGVRKNGYFEVDEDPSEGREEANEYARREFAEIDFTELRLLDARPNLLQPKVFPYVPIPNEDDALLDDIPSDDDFVSGYEEDDALLSNEEDLQGEGAEAHKLVPPSKSS